MTRNTIYCVLEKRMRPGEAGRGCTSTDVRILRSYFCRRAANKAAKERAFRMVEEETERSTPSPSFEVRVIKLDGKIYARSRREGPSSSSSSASSSSLDRVVWVQEQEVSGQTCAGSTDGEDDSNKDTNEPDEDDDCSLLSLAGRLQQAETERAQEMETDDDGGDGGGDGSDSEDDGDVMEPSLSISDSIVYEYFDYGSGSEDD